MLVCESFYEAAVIPELWSKALDLSGQVWAADAVTISSRPNCTNGLVYSTGGEELCGRYLDDGWYKDDVRAARGVSFIQKGNDIVTDLDLFSADELERHPYYAQFLGKAGFRWFAGTILSQSEETLMTLSLERRVQGEPFSQGEITRIRRDLPHLKRAARLAARSRLAYADGLVDGLAKFDCGAILVDRLGRVLRMNEKAETYLASDLKLVSSRLCSPDRDANKALQGLITASTHFSSGGEAPVPKPAVLNRSSGLPLVVSSYPVIRQASDVFQGARAILLLTNLGEHRPAAPDLLHAVFRLTAAELRVAAALLRGLNTQEIAAAQQVGAPTIRFHLKSLFAKTGTRHQAQLVSLLSRFVDTGRNGSAS